jgi:hypothetical protein
MRGIIVTAPFLLILTSLCKAYGGDEVPVLNLPVVYVLFGQIPMYLRINIELAARHNDVLIISDSNKTVPTLSSRRRIAYASLDKYMSSAIKFEPHYKHMSQDVSAVRKIHELRCFQVFHRQNATWYTIHSSPTVGANAATNGFYSIPAIAQN